MPSVAFLPPPAKDAPPSVVAPYTNALRAHVGTLITVLARARGGAARDETARDAAALTLLKDTLRAAAALLESTELAPFLDDGGGDARALNGKWRTRAEARARARALAKSFSIRTLHNCRLACKRTRCALTTTRASLGDAGGRQLLRTVCELCVARSTPSPIDVPVRDEELALCVSVQ